MTITHIAGVDVQVGTQLRQRCSWCGAVLIDEDLRNVMVPTEDADKPFPTWPVGALIRRDGFVTSIVEHEDGAQLPDDCCGQLDHSVTGARSDAGPG